MSLNSLSPRLSRNRLGSIVLILGLGLLISATVLAQTTVGTGSIVGTVTDASGAVVSGAKVVITGIDTGQLLNLTTNTSGSYNSGPLDPGAYKVEVSLKGFRTVEESLTVQVGNTATANVSLQVGQESQVIEVQGSTLQVNTEQAEVQGVLTASQIENLPVNGRNFLDLAQLEPGVQIQDGQNFDPTKAGYSSISFGGRFGRTARINVDGVDISDETVGTTTADIPASAIDEFQLGQSSLDLSNDLTSSGAVNVTTKSGTNSIHGEAFGLIRDHSFAANSPGGHDYYLQRDQFGGSVGGAIIKNKMFYFLDGERTKQDSFAPVQLNGSPFAALSGGFGQPFRESDLLAKADYNLSSGAKLFYRYSYFSNSLFATFGFGYSIYDNKDYTRQHVAGIDFNTGSFTHTIRFSYLKFQNQILDVTSGNTAIPDCCFGLMLSSPPFYAGPNYLAPQSTPQQNYQAKYDGSKAIHSHVIRYGVSYNHIQGGGFANFYGTAPRVSWTAGTLPVSGDPANPLNYPVQRFRVGNGQGFSTLDPALGFPAGGLGPDNRLGVYAGDAWKIKPNFTLSFGLRYDRDTGRTDSDLPAIPAINAQFPGYGNPVKQANLNFAPQLGFAWDPSKNGRTVIRGGIGLYYENVIYNNVLFDRPLRLATGAFNQVTSACLGGTARAVPVNTGTLQLPPGVCGARIGDVIPQLIQFQNAVKAGNPFNLQAPNPSYIGTFLSEGIGTNAAVALFDPNYKTPRSLQLNFGIQREIRPGMVFSADYLRNVETRTLIGFDVNKQGNVANFNLVGANAAVAATLAACGAASVDAAIGPAGCPGLYPATSGAPAGSATISDFASNGLSAAADVAGVGCNQPVLNGGLGRPCAFGGINQMQSQMFFLKPEGRSVYNALQMKLAQNYNNPFRGVKALNFQVSYSLSRFDNTGGLQVTGTPADNDQDFVLQAVDNNNSGRYFGPSLLDRTHQVSFGGYVDVPGGFRFGLISHFYSPLAIGLIAPTTGAPGDIFLSDYTGDGTVGDPLPGTKFGDFGRGVNAGNINNLINKYNSTVAGQPTLAGQQLINSGVLTLTQLQTMGGVAETIPNASPGQQDFGWLRASDLKVAWHYTLRERFSFEPSVGFYNIFNFSNFNLPPNTMNGLLNGPGSGSINGTTRLGQEQFRVGNGTGVYSLGSQRQIEFGLRLTF
ncbi:MAG: Oar protein [Acidobacteriaceae bacterium]|nr:Oar protein [Acidobacteriaceae bacterium]